MASSSTRFGSLAAVGFVLATFVGCAAPGITASSPREPAPSFPPDLGALRADSPPPPARIAPERAVNERSNAQAREPRTFRPEYCRRCSN